MSQEDKYLKNPWIEHYLDEVDEVVQEYLNARTAGNVRGMARAINKMGSIKDRATWIERRIEKIDSGSGDKKNGKNGWNPPEPVLPPEAVRAVKE